MVDKSIVPVLKGHVFFAEVERGVYFNGGSERTFVLQGKGLYPLVSRLIAAMDGRATAVTLSESLPPPAQPLFWKLLGELDTRNLLVDFRDVGEVLPDWYWQVFADTLGYFRDSRPNFANAFRHWRDTRIFAAGSGYVLKALVRALARSGTRHLTVVDDGSAQGAVPLAEITAALEDHAARDGEFRFEVVTVEECVADLARAQRVAYGSDVIERSCQSPILQALLACRDIPVLAGGVLDGEGFVGPESFIDACTLLDLSERLRLSSSLPRHSLTSRSVIGNLLALETMRSTAGLPRGLRTGQSALLRNWFLHVSPGPEITLRPVLPAPGRERGGVVSVPEITGELPSEREATEAERLMVRLTAMFDARTGLFSREPGNHVSQLPLAHDAIAVHWPRSCARAPAVVTGWGLDGADALQRTLLRAVACYASGVEAALPQQQRHRLVAGDGETDWRWRALLRAIADAVNGLGDVTVWALTTDAIRAAVARVDDGAETWRMLSSARNLRVLVRLVQLYQPENPTIRLARCGRRGPFLAKARVSGIEADGYGLSADLALIECLGELCSRYQLGQALAGDESPEWTMRAEPAANIPADCEKQIVDAAEVQAWLYGRGWGVYEHRFDADPALAAYGLVVGGVSLKRL